MRDRVRIYSLMVVVAVIAVLGVTQYLMAAGYNRGARVPGRCANVPGYGNLCNSNIYDSVPDPYGGSNPTTVYRSGSLPSPYSLCDEQGANPTNVSMTNQNAGVSCREWPTPVKVNGSSGYNSGAQFIPDSPCDIEVRARCCIPPPVQNHDVTVPATGGVPGRCAFDIPTAVVGDPYAPGGPQVTQRGNFCAPTDYSFPYRSCPSVPLPNASGGLVNIREARIVDNQQVTGCTIGYLNGQNGFTGADRRNYDSVPCNINATITCAVIQDPYGANSCN